MGRGRKEEQAPGAPIWMVSFTDSMTNLLTFFILLITFSAFGDFGEGSGVGMGLKGSGATLQKSSKPNRSNSLPPMNDPSRKTAEGSERPNPTADNNPLTRPRAPIGIADTEVYSDRKIIRIPSRLIFYGWGSYITEAGRQHLEPLAQLLRLHPSHVIVGESSHLHPNHPLFDRPTLNADRAWSVIDYFTAKQGLPVDRFSMEAKTAVPADAFNEEPVIELVLTNRRVYP